MAAMDIKAGNTVVGMLLGNLKRQYTAQKVILTATDGTVYAQNTGRPIVRFEVNCYCGTAEDRDAVDDASNNGDVVTVTTKDNVDVVGYIEDDSISWKEWVDGHGVGKFTLIVR
ncbi:MAG: hypothetical protein IKX20_11135 [Paludibacteraceae bacterium]|nr:hypothetical protein [Paludibacteraceae bacterium]